MVGTGGRPGPERARDTARNRETDNRSTETLRVAVGAGKFAKCVNLGTTDWRESSTWVGRRVFDNGVSHLGHVDWLNLELRREWPDGKSSNAVEDIVDKLVELCGPENRRRNVAVGDCLLGRHLVLVVGEWMVVDADDRDVHEILDAGLFGRFEQSLGPSNVDGLCIATRGRGGVNDDVHVLDGILDASSVREIQFTPL